jgi:hypothetical protein
VSLDVLAINVNQIIGISLKLDVKYVIAKKKVYLSLQQEVSHAIAKMVNVHVFKGVRF